jgi:hypothetical protein
VRSSGGESRERASEGSGDEGPGSILEAAGVEPENRRVSNLLTACRLWSQLLTRRELTDDDRVVLSPRWSPGVDRILGEILEAAGTERRRAGSRRLQSRAEVEPSSSPRARPACGRAAGTPAPSRGHSQPPPGSDPDGGRRLRNRLLFGADARAPRSPSFRAATATSPPVTWHRPSAANEDVTLRPVAGACPHHRRSFEHGLATRSRVPRSAVKQLRAIPAHAVGRERKHSARLV